MRLTSRTALAIVLALALPQAASAATTIGSTMPGFTGDTLSCPDPGGCTFVPTTIAGTPVAVPYDGLIMRWSARVPVGGSPIGVRVLRPAPGGALSSVGSSVGRPNADGVISLRTHMQVRAGDLIGVDLDETDEIGVFAHAGFDSTSHTFLPILGDSETRLPDVSEPDDFEALFNATVERDADGDGYGDDTEDGCPQLAQTRVGCSLPPSRVLVDPGPSASAGMPRLGAVMVGGTTTVQTTVDAGPQWTANAVLTLALSSGISAVEARGPAPCAVTPTRIECPLGSLAPGQVVSVSAVVRGLNAAGLTRYGAWKVPVASVVASVATATQTSQPKSGLIRVLSTAACGNEAITSRLPDPGTWAGDRLIGTASADTFSGLAGHDCLFGKGATDTVAGGTGNDRVEGNAGNDVLRGEAGADHLTGGSGLDRLDGGSGNDRVEAVDRKRDVVRCGDGRDRARVDRIDSVAGCESVTRVPAVKKKPRRR